MLNYQSSLFSHPKEPRPPRRYLRVESRSERSARSGRGLRPRTSDIRSPRDNRDAVPAQHENDDLIRKATFYSIASAAQCSDMSEVRIAVGDIILERTFEFELRGDVIIQHPRCRVQLTNVYVRNQTLSHEHSVDAARIA